MGDCCQNSNNLNDSKHKKFRWGWWLLGGFVIVGGLLWAFQENPLVNQLAPFALIGLTVVWLVSLARHRMGVG